MSAVCVPIINAAPPPPPPVFGDDFNRSDRPIDGDNGWTFVQNGPNNTGIIQSQNLYFSLGAGFTGMPHVYRDVGTPNGTVKGQHQASFWRMFFRYVDPQNFLYLTSTGEVYRVVAGAQTLLVDLAPWASGEDAAFGNITSVQSIGDTHQVYDGVNPFGSPIVTSVHLTATKCGLGHGGWVGSSSPWDNFLYTPA